MLMLSIGEDWILWSTMNGRENDFRKNYMIMNYKCLAINFFPNSFDFQ